jgi:TetR/AcrR family transcriptional repressor of nem operon
MMSDRKQQILDVAAELLETRVFSAFSYQDIADRLGITKAAIHSHYRTKETLGNALLEQYLVKTMNLYSEAESAGDTAWDKFNAFVAILVRTVIDENKICPLTLLQVEHHIIPESMQKGIRKILSMDKALLTKILKQGRDEGEMLFRGTPEDQASLIQAAVSGAFMMARAEGVETLEKTMAQIKINMKPA